MIITCLFSKYFQILYILPKSSNNLLFLNIYLPFFWKIAAIPLLSKIDPVRCFVKSSLAFSQLQNMLTYFSTTKHQVIHTHTMHTKTRLSIHRDNIWLVSVWSLKKIIARHLIVLAGTIYQFWAHIIWELKLKFCIHQCLSSSKKYKFFVNYDKWS